MNESKLGGNVVSLDKIIMKFWDLGRRSCGIYMVGNRDL